MNAENLKKHWDEVFKTKSLEDVSWYQPTPKTSLDFFKKHDVSKNAKIIDVGGGDSYLVDHLLELGYLNVTVLDISTSALEKAKKRLGVKAALVTWIASDIADFEPTEKYDVWHDRAAFHFLTDPEDIRSYIASINKSIKDLGILIIGTFSMDGPNSCSGLAIQQYSESSMRETVGGEFEQLSSETIEHYTPSRASQRFIFGCFQRKKRR